MNAVSPLTGKTDANRVKNFCQRHSNRADEGLAESFKYLNFFRLTGISLAVFLVTWYCLIPAQSDFSLASQVRLWLNHPLIGWFWFGYWFFLRGPLLEWWLHKDLLHNSTVPFLGILSKKHRAHHGKTVVTTVKSEQEGQDLELSDHTFKYRAQQDHRAFGWYAHISFLVYYALRYVLPSALLYEAVLYQWHINLWWIVAGALPGALAVWLYVNVYEVVHYWFHLPLETWEWAFRLPLVGNRVYQWYKHHEEHHEHMFENLNVVIGIADVLLGTANHRKRVRETGRLVPSGDFPEITPNQWGLIYSHFETVCGLVVSFPAFVICTLVGVKK